jgi:DnaJ family protein A protein 5
VQAKRERSEAQARLVREAAEERDERLEADYVRMEAEMDAMYLGSDKKKKPSDVIVNELYCVACRKTFRSEKQLEVHEGSKKHRELVRDSVRGSRPRMLVRTLHHSAPQ